ncbi:MAG TPA: serine acetyltransferase [Verrucomicrobiae bacterium]|jgi:serine acetyltransferase|nr:serine acetyltransferase [Verrucomicrobiae bacterium]
MTEAASQLRYLAHELRLITGGKPIRWLILFFEPSAGVVISYRIDRFFFLIFGDYWTLLRIAAFPVFFLLRLLSCRHELCWRADFGKGLRILHPTLGVVAAGEAVVGEDCTLCGGNSIGMRKGLQRGDLILGNRVFMGINSCVLGPARIGNRVMIGAGAIVISDLADDCVAVGVPAVPNEKL